MRYPYRLSLLSLALVAAPAAAKVVEDPPPIVRGTAPLRRNEATARIQAQVPALRAQLGLSDRDDLVPKRTLVDDRGQAHVRFQQMHQGLRVVGAEAILHMDAQGAPLAPTMHHLVKGLSIASVQPAITADRAQALALMDLKAKGAITAKQAELVIHPNVSGPQASFKRNPDGSLSVDRAMMTFGRSSSKEAYILAYLVHLEAENPQDGALSRDYLLDAQTGVILKKWNSLQTLASGTPDASDTPVSAPRPKLISGKTEYRGDVTVQGATVTLQRTNPDDGSTTTFDTDTLWDTTRGTLPHPVTGLVGNHILNSAGHVDLFFFNRGRFFEHASPDPWGDGQNFDFLGFGPGGDVLHAFDATGETAALDAHAGIGDTWDFYKNVFGRDGIDDLGTSVLGRVHFWANYPNAYWQTGAFAMSFGDGDGATLKTVTSLDVMGHELSHGVTAFTADLAYYSESGGLNESNSDIMGTMVEFYSRGAGGVGPTVPDTGGNWTIGEQVAGPSLGGALRWFDKPSKDGDFSFDSWFNGVGLYDVHASSGIGNRMFYYLSNGAPVNGDAATPYAPNGFAGIGNDKAAHIWYRTLSAYLTPLSDYHDARAQAIRSATDLFGDNSAEVAAVENAFGAVGVGGLHGLADPAYVILDSGSLVFDGTGYGASGNLLAVVAAGQDSRPFQAVVAYTNGGNQGLSWSLPSGGGSVDATTGVFHAPLRAPTTLAAVNSNVYVLQAASTAYPLAYAQGLAFPVMADCDLDNELDAVDALAIPRFYGTQDNSPLGFATWVGSFGTDDLSVADLLETFTHAFTTE